MALSLWGIKLIVIATLWIVGFIFVLLPRALHKIPEAYRDYFVSLAQACSGGIFLAAAMIDMFPGGLQDFYELMESNALLSAQITCIIFVCGFLLIFLVEKVLFVGLLEPRKALTNTKAINQAQAAQRLDVTSVNSSEREILYSQTKSDLMPEVPVNKFSASRNSTCEHNKFSIGCLTDTEDSYLVPRRGNDYIEDSNSELDPVDVLEKTLSHGFKYIQGTRNDKVAIALDIVEDTFSVKLSRMAEDNPLVYLSLTFVLSIHTLIAGIAMGVCTETSCVTPIFIGVLSHLWVVALALGISLHRSKVKFKVHFGIAIFWSSMCPLGVIAGSITILFLSNNILLALQGFFISLAAGTFIYVAVVDVILQEFTDQRYKYQKFFFLIAGFVSLGALLLFLGG